MEPLEDRRLLAVGPVNLGDLDGTNGFRLDGLDDNDMAGYSVSSAGDVNGDGFDDLIIGAHRADGSGHTFSGETYVVFGHLPGYAASLDLASLDGANGFRLDGIDIHDNSGYSVSSAGDINGDDFDDLIIGAKYGSPGGELYAGEAYVVFGHSGEFPSSLALSALNGTNGFRLEGIDRYDQAGRSVSSAGDVNGDGFDDLIIGSPYADPGDDSASGETYVVFGHSGSYTASFDMAFLDGVNGFRLEGIDEDDNSGYSVSFAGDVNGDGFDDLIIGAYLADPNGMPAAGETYVVFGHVGDFSASLDLSALDGTNGFRFDGVDTLDLSGYSVSSAGDVNGDGFDDMIIGAYHADPGDEGNAGETYVVFGHSAEFSASFDLAALDGVNGFRLDGIDWDDNSGISVSFAGDVNGDGFDDLIIGAPYAAPGDIGRAGETYVVFGRPSGFLPSFELSALDGTDGFRIDGIDEEDESGRSVSSAGDVNGDGFDDLIIGAHYADPGGDNFAGEAYVVFGGNFTGGAETQVGDSATNTLIASQGGAATDILVGGQAADLLQGDGGPDVLRGGEGNDILVVPAIDFQRLLGGNGTDTLRLDGSDISLDLTTIADNKIVDIEVIDISGNGDNTLTLDVREVLNISTHSNTLLVQRDLGDVVSQGDGWTRLTDEMIGGRTFRVFTQGAAALKVATVPGFTIAKETNGISVSESGTTEHFDVVLDSRPGADVIITLTSNDPDEATVDKTSLTFTPDNWDDAQPVTVMGKDDAVMDGDQTTTITLAVDDANSDDAFDEVPDTTVLVTTTDNDSAGVLIDASELTTTESGAAATFTIVLQSEPAADVAVTFSSSDLTEGDVTSTNPLTFTAGNWYTPQTVTITGLDDHLLDGDVAYTITADFSSNDSGYNDCQVDALTVTNLDDDEPGITVTPTTGLSTSETGDTASFTVVLQSEPTADVTITVIGDFTEGEISPTTLTFSPETWNQPLGLTITGLDDHLADGDVTYTLVTDVSSGDSDYNDYQLPALTVTNVDDDAPGITVTPTTNLTTSESGDSTSFNVVLRSEPTADVTITVTGDATEGELSPAKLTFSPGNWDEPQGFTITGVDDHVADGNVTYTLLTDVSSDDSDYNDYNDYQLPSLTVTNVDDDEPGITVTPTTGLTTSESGDSASFTVVLQSEPTADVVITVTGDATESEVSPAKLTFSAGNWNEPQAVTITGLDDHVADGNVTYTLLTDVFSEDSNYNDYQLPSLTVTNVDDDEPGITVTPTTGLTTSENGDSANFTVVLQSEPTADVTIPISTSNEAEVSALPAALTFTSENWSTPQTVTATGVDDDVDDGDVSCAVVIGAAVSDDANYNGWDADDVQVTNEDDDEGFVPEDLGQVDFRRLESLAPAGQELWFQLETAHKGWLTVVADAEWTADQLSLALYDPGDLAAPLAVSDASQAAPRFDYAAGQGDVLLLQVTGTTSDAALLVANLVHEAGTAVTVFGTADADVLTFDAAASREITINDVVYRYEDSEVATVDFDGGEGRDSVWLYDSTGDESLEAWPDHASFVNASGDDVADFAVQVSGIEDLLAYATRGGTNDAVFHGSADGDKFKSYEDSVRLRARNSIYTLRAKKFDAVLGDAGSGGKDVAVFNGSDGDDAFRFRGAENAAQLEGKRRNHTASGFGSIVVRAGGGENDAAYLADFPAQDSGVDDVVYFKAHKTQLVGVEVEVTVRAFDVVHATASESGFDVARIYDTSGDDHLEVDGDAARLYRRSGTELDLLYEAIGFERDKAYSTAGDDTTDIGDHDFDLILNGWDD